MVTLDGDSFLENELVEFPKYSLSEYTCKPSLSEQSTLSQEAFSIHHSFGYDCSRESNLHVLDAQTIVFVTGNLIHFLNPDAGTVKLQPSSQGTGISAIQVHPTEPILAVAELGTDPPILFYRWPDLNVSKVLKGGATKGFDCCVFSSNGKFFASQACGPDWLLTVWNWREEKILASRNSPHQANSHVFFSGHDPSNLVTCGPGHLTFWELSGPSSRRLSYSDTSFSTTDTGEISCAVESSERGKVISTTNWGSLLIWKDERIYLELFRKDGSRCHDGAIYHLVSGEGELITLGGDGWIRVWDLSHIDAAVPACGRRARPQARPCYRLDPMNEVEVEVGATLKSIAKSKQNKDAKGATDQNFWYIQDGSGSIWKVDLSFSLSMQKPSRVYRSHASAVNALSASSFHPFLLSGGLDGKTCIYDLNRRTLLNQVEYSAAVSCLQWIPTEIDPSGLLVLIGYADGVLRLFAIESEGDSHGGSNIYRVTRSLSAKSRLILAHKPHHGPIVGLVTSRSHNIICSLGDDATVFFFYLDLASRAPTPVGSPPVQGWSRSPSPLTSPSSLSPAISPRPSSPVGCVVKLVPVRAFQLPEQPTRLQWREGEANKYEACITYSSGEIWHLTPAEDYFKPPSDDHSFMEALPEYSSINAFAEGDTASLEVFHACFLTAWPEFFVVFARAADDNARCSEELLILFQFKPLAETKRFPLPRLISGPHQPRVSQILFWLNDEFLFLGYTNGHFRAHKLVPGSAAISSPEHWTLGNFWSLPLHGPRNGRVRAVFPTDSTAGQMVATCADDGGIVLIKLGTELAESVERMKQQQLKARSSPSSGSSRRKLSANRMSWGLAAASAHGKEDSKSIPDHVEDIEDPNHLSLEEARQCKAKELASLGVEERKLHLQRHLASIKSAFRTLQQRNAALPGEFRLAEDRFKTTEFTFPDIEAEIERRLQSITDSAEESTRYSKGVLEKIRRRFFNDVLAPRQVVRGIRSTEVLSGFRIARSQPINVQIDLLTGKHPAGFESATSSFSHSKKKALCVQSDELQLSDEDEDPGDDDSPPTDGSPSQPSSWKSFEVLASLSEDIATLKKPLNERLLDGRVLKALKKQDEKKEKQIKRKKEWDELLSRKPNEQEDDPDLVEEIAQARAHLGQYTRKTSPSYENTNPIRAEELAKKLMNLLLQIKSRKEEFNEKVSNLAQKKAQLIKVLQETRNQLNSVQVLLPIDKRKTIPQMPELCLDEIVQDPFKIDRREVLKIEQKLAQQQQSGFLQQQQQQQQQTERTPSTERSSRRTSLASQQQQHSRGLTKHTGKAGNLAALGRHGQDRWSPPPLEEEPLDAPFVVYQQHLSKMETESSEMEIIKNEYEEKRLIETMEEMIAAFDDTLGHLVTEKLQLNSKLKYSELSMICLYEELQVLRATQEEDDAKVDKVERLKASLEDIELKIGQKSQKLVTVSSNLSQYRDLLKSTHDTLHSELLDHKNRDYLLKLFNQKSRDRRKSQVNPEEEEPLCPVGNTPVQSFDLTEWQDSDATKLENEIPEDLDEDAIKFIQNLKKRRDLLESGIRSEETSLKTIQTVLSRLRAFQGYQESLYQEAKQELHEFRVKKQARLNELEVVIGLYRDQMPLSPEMYKNSGESGPDYQPDPVLVFMKEKWQRLQTRTEELKTERISFKNKFKEDRQIYLTLQDQCKAMRNDIERMEKQCAQEMEKRFGEGVTFEDLESFAINRNLEEMKELAKRREKSMYKNVEAKKIACKSAQQTLTKAILENTRLMDTKTRLMEELQLLDKRDSHNKEREPKIFEAQERERDEREELRELNILFESQQTDLHDIRVKLAKFMTKGVPIHHELNIHRRPSDDMKKITLERLKSRHSELSLKETSMKKHCSSTSVGSDLSGDAAAEAILIHDVTEAVTVHRALDSDLEDDEEGQSDQDDDFESDAKDAEDRPMAISIDKSAT